MTETIGNHDNKLTKMDEKRGSKLIQDIEKFREEIEKNKLNPPCMDQEYLVKFLYARNFNVQKSVELLKNYLAFKTSNCSMFAQPFRIKSVFDGNIMQLLDQRTASGEAVLVIKPGNWNPSLSSFEMIAAATILSCERAALEEEGQANGMVMIADMDKLGWKQLKHFGPFQAKKIADIIQHIVPIRINAIHLFNQSRISDIAYTLVKPFLSEHFRKKIHFHGTKYSQLEPVIESKFLHTELGGNAGSFECQQFYMKLAKDEELWQSLGFS